MTYTMATATPKKIDGGFEISRRNNAITITREPDKADEKYKENYKKRFGVNLRNYGRPVAVNTFFNKIPGCCSGTMLSRLTFPLHRTSDVLGQGKQISVAKRAKLLKILMNQFNREAMLLYVCRSDNKYLPKVFTKAGWKKSRGPVGRYSPYNYTLDTYTVDPRTPKRKLPPLKKKIKKKVVTQAQPVYVGWRKYFGFSISNIKRRIGGLRQ